MADNIVRQRHPNGEAQYFVAQKPKVETPQLRGHRTRRARVGEEAPSPRIRTGKRPSGTPHRAGLVAKEALLAAFERLGGVAGLVKWGKKNPTEFYRIWSRLVPKEDTESARVIGVEDLLATLAEAERVGIGSPELRDMDAAGELLGLPRPEHLA